MNRYVRAAAAALAIAGGFGSVGCVHSTGATRERDGGRWNNLYDTAWPDRYNYAARQSVMAPFSQQVTNGQFIDQTLWNWYFEPGSDRLNGAGMAKLDSLAQRTPAPDPRLYLQAARDLPATPDNYDRVVGMRDDLTARRAAAIQKYMATQPGTPVAYEIAVHDAPVPGIYAPFTISSFRGQTRGYVGGIGGTAVVGGSLTGNISGGGGLNQGVSGAAGAGGGTAPVPTTGPGMGGSAPPQ